MDENELGTIVVDIALEIHRELGPGLLESVYEVVLAHALRERGLRIERQVPISIKYRGLVFEEGFRADIIVQQRLLLEIKCVEALANVHKKQLLTYLRLTGMKLGYLLNFSAPLLKTGIVRIVNGLEGTPDSLRIHREGKCDLGQDISRGDAEIGKKDGLPRRSVFPGCLNLL